MHGKTQFTGTLQRLVRHVFRAPNNVLKQTIVFRLHSKQVVAAVEGGPEHHPVARVRKHLRGLDQKRRGQRGAIGIENYCGTIAPL